MEQARDHAVVLGGSMAGILAAQVLVDHYGSVTVVDRDQFPATSTHRRGVPQGRHIHALQTQGVRLIDGLFPGAIAALVEEGAVAGDWGDATMCFGGRRLARASEGLELLGVSRPRLETHLRARLTADPRVVVRERHDVHGLVVDRRGSGCVTGVRVLPRQPGSAEEVLHADLVVDATGRASRLPHWLEATGYSAPDVEETGLEVAYTSCRYPRHPEDAAIGMVIGATPPDGRRGGGAIPVEGDAWVVTLVGVGGEHAPTDRAGFRAYAGTLPLPDLHDLVRDREPLDEPVLMRHPSSRRHRYDRLARFPDGLVVAGDALCSFNPAYGQGMTVAAMEAVALDDCLRQGQERVGPRFLDAATEIVDVSWEMGRGRDASFLPELAAQRSRAEQLLSRYQRRLLDAAVVDPVVSRAFRAVMAMVAPPQSLAHPGIAARVLTHRWRRRRGGPAARSTSAPVGTR